MSKTFRNEYWLIGKIGWVHVFGPFDGTYSVSEPINGTHRSGAERLRLCCLASDVVNGKLKGRVMARARLRPDGGHGTEARA